MPNSPVLFELHSKQFSLFTSVNDGGWRLGASASFNETGIIGRSAPLVTFAHSDSVTLSVLINLAALEDAQSEVADVCLSLISLTKPETPGEQPPSLIQVTLAGILKNWDCVLTQVNEHIAPHPVFDESGVPHFADCELSFLGVEIENKAAKSWAKSSNFRQTAFRG